jgi:hypothetical protein
VQCQQHTRRLLCSDALLVNVVAVLLLPGMLVILLFSAFLLLVVLLRLVRLLILLYAWLPQMLLDVRPLHH